MPHTNLRDAIYRGKDPIDAPAYFLVDAAHHLHLPPATVRSWTLGRDYPTADGSRMFSPLIKIADADRRLLSFRNLAEIHVLSSIRRIHAVSMKAVRNAIEFLRGKFGSEHPLLDREMLTDGADLFVEHYGDLVNVSAHGQMEMGKLLGAYLKRIARDKLGTPIRLFPFTRTVIEEAPKLVSIDPKICFGKPCIAGTRIPTAIIAERYQAGDAHTILAEDYGRTTEEIEEAIRYESRTAA